MNHIGTQVRKTHLEVLAYIIMRGGSEKLKLAGHNEVRKQTETANNLWRVEAVVSYQI